MGKAVLLLWCDGPGCKSERSREAVRSVSSSMNLSALGGTQEIRAAYADSCVVIPSCMCLLDLTCCENEHTVSELQYCSAAERPFTSSGCDGRSSQMDQLGPMAARASWRFAQYFSPDILHTRSMSLHVGLHSDNFQHTFRRSGYICGRQRVHQLRYTIWVEQDESHKHAGYVRNVRHARSF